MKCSISTVGILTFLSSCSGRSHFCSRLSPRWRLFLWIIVMCQLIFLLKRAHSSTANIDQALLMTHKIYDELPDSLGLARKEELSTLKYVSASNSRNQSRKAWRVCELPIPSPIAFSHMLDVQAYSWKKLDLMISNHVQNGSWWPQWCEPHHHVAIIVAYRERDENLRVFLLNLHAFLQRQNIHYAIFVIEQTQGTEFNRAALFNVGFLEAIRYDNRFQCFVFHDVDLIPEDNRNLYTCGKHPRHMSVAVNIFKYRLPYDEIFGGVSALNRSHFFQVNGFSNAYFGWGGEDDDLSNRLVFHGLDFVRYPLAIGRYYMLTHGKDKGNKVNPLRQLLLRNGRFRMQKDGLNSLRYTIIDRPKHRLMVRIVVLLHEKAILKNIMIETEQIKRSQEAMVKSSSKLLLYLQGFAIWELFWIGASLLYLVRNVVFVFKNVFNFIATLFVCKRTTFCAN